MGERRKLTDAASYYSPGEHVVMTRADLEQLLRRVQADAVRYAAFAVAEFILPPTAKEPTLGHRFAHDYLSAFHPEAMR